MKNQVASSQQEFGLITPISFSNNCKRLQLPRSARKRQFSPAGLLDLRPQLWKPLRHQYSGFPSLQWNNWIYMAMKWKPNSRRQNQIHRTWDRGVHKWDHRKDPRSVGRLHVVNAFLLRFAWMTCCRRFHRRNLVPKILENLKMPLR